MAILSRTKNNKDKTSSASLAYVIRNPRITEKAAIKEGVFTFDISPRANKKEVEKAVLALYKVTPKMVRIVNIPAKEKMTRGKKGSTARGKKAYVYLKDGDTINLS